MKNNDKLDAMMRSYCERNVTAFEYKKKKHTMMYTSVLAATLVVAILFTILIIPAPKSSDSVTNNSFVLSVSANEADENDTYHTVSANEVYQNYGVEELYVGPSLKVVGKSIEKVHVYSQNGYTGLSCFAKNYNVTDKYHFENFPVREGVPDPLFVTPYIENSDGEFVKADLSTEHARQDVYYTCLDIVDENRHDDEKYIVINAIPINEAGENLMPEDFSSKYNDVAVVEVTYLNGEVQTQYASVTYENDRMIFEITS